jgi:hypothetical protein
MPAVVTISPRMLARRCHSLTAEPMACNKNAAPSSRRVCERAAGGVPGSVMVVPSRHRSIGSHRCVYILIEKAQRSQGCSSCRKTSWLADGAATLADSQPMPAGLAHRTAAQYGASVFDHSHEIGCRLHLVQDFVQSKMA